MLQWALSGKKQAAANTENGACQPDCFRPLGPVPQRCLSVTLSYEGAWTI